MSSVITTATPPVALPTRSRLRIALVANLILQGVIVVTGGLVRLTGSGLGCPTWPQCTAGSFTPVAQQEQGWHVFVEFGNRMMTFVLGAVAVWLLVEAVRRAVRLRTPEARSFAWWAAVPLLGIVAQAVVGGIIVLAKLDPRTVSPHFLLSIALIAFSAWLLVRYDEGDGPVVATVDPTLRRLSIAAGVLFAVVVGLGTAVTGSGPHSGDADETVRFGFDPVATSRLHSGAVWLFVASLVAVFVLSRRGRGAPPAYRKWWTAALHLSLLEGVVGYLQYALALPIGLVAVHLLISATLTGVVSLAVLSSRRRITPHEGLVAPH